MRDGRDFIRIATENSRDRIRRSCLPIVGSLFVLLAVVPATASATALSSPITENMTLSAGGSPYTGGSIKIEPGVTVKAEPGVKFVVSSIEVLGTLKAEGSAEAPVAFKPATESGRWGGLVFKAGSGGSVLDHAEVVRAGESFGNAITITGSSPTITHSTIRENTYYGIFVTGASGPEIAYNVISGSASSGAYYGSESGKTMEINFHGNLLEGNGGSNTVGVQATSGTVVATSLGGNTLTKNSSLQAINYNGGSTGEIPPDIANNIVNGNTGGSSTNQVSVSGIFAKSATWESPTAPIYLQSGTSKVASGATLTLKPGVTIHGGSTNSSIEVLGTLKAEGSAEAPVAFKPATESGRWGGLVFKAGSGGSVLDHAEVVRAGESFGNAITITGSSPTITHSTIRENTYYGIFVTGASGPEIAYNVISGSASSGAYYGSESGKTMEINFHGNLLEGNGGSNTVGVQATSGTVVATSLGGNTLTKNSSLQAINYNGGSTGEIPPDIANNIVNGNTGGSSTNQVSVSGIFAKSATWESPTAPIYLQSGTSKVASGATLTLKPGVTIHGGSTNSSIEVLGTLKAEGSAEAPVAFLGVSGKSPGEWGNIKFGPGSSASVLDHVEIAYGGSATSSGAIEVRGSSPTITNTTLRKSQYYGISVVESGSPKIEWDRFRGNTDGLSYSGTGSLNAPNNDWGCASGPKPAGCGDSVTSNVKWKPAIQLPELAGHCRGKESQCGEGADPVSLATGQLDYSHEDLLLTNKSEEPLEFTRAYTSGSSADTGLGPGWSQSGLLSATELESGEVLILRQDGRQDLFKKTESGYEAPSGVTDSLAKVEGTFQLTTLQGTVYRFDTSGRIASITDSHGLKTVYAYNSEGRLATITDPSSQTLTFAYNGSNHITSVKDSTGREVKFGYSAAGDLETVMDALGGVTKYAYDSQHRLTSITDPRSDVILKNVYDSQGRIVEQRDGLEHLWKMEYAPSETIVTEPEGGKRKYGFDPQDRVVSETDQLGNKTTVAYDEAGNVHEIVKPGGAKWTFGHDAVGNLTSVKDPEGGERKYEYNAQNRPAAFTDARGDTSSYEWSKAGDLLKIVDPEKGETTFTYNESGQPLTKTDPDKHKTELSYDSRGNVLSTTDPLGHKTSFEYDSRSYLTSKTAPGLKAEKFERNTLGDMLSRTTPEGNKTKYVYDANGLPTQVTDPGENIWKIERNAMERPTAYTDPLEQQSKTTYNGELKPVKVVNRRGKETTYAYNAANQLTEVDQPEGGDWHFGYDSRGNRSSVIDPREHETTYKYDLLDRMTEADEPLSATTKYGYDANGDLTAVTDPRGNATSYAYDKLGRLVEVDQPLEKTTTYSYDAASNQVSRTTAAGALEYGYDAANRLTKVSTGESTLRSFSYDAANRRTSAVDAQGHKIEIGYSGDGLVTSINDGRGQSLTRAYNSRGELTKQVDGRGTLEYGYDKLGRLTSLTDPQSKALSFGYDPEGDLAEVKRPNGVTTTNVYNDAGRLAETTSKEEPSTVLEALKYGYDGAGNVTSKLDSRLEQETTFSYDALNRITEFNSPGEGTTSYGYDEAGNRTEAGATTYSFNALNQLTSASDGTTYSYDGAGRMTGKEEGSEKTSYEWDLLDHLAKVEGPTETTSYAYDGLERPSERKGGSSTQVVHYGDLTDLPTYNANVEGKTTTTYVQGAHGLVEQRSGEATDYPLADAHGDITAITGSTGGVESRQEYSPWGEQLSGPSLEMGYLGAWERPTDPASGLIQMGARTYDPSLGSFASQDSVLGHLGLGASVDRYLYVWDNPLGLHDLDGRDVCVLGACAGEAAEDIGNAANEAWHTGSYVVTHPGEAATNAVNYWGGSDSKAAYVFGPLSILGDIATNPDRAGYYLEKANPAQMAATGIVAAGTVGAGGLTVIATSGCLAVTPELEALHVCSFVGASGMTVTAAGGALTYVVASK